MIKINLGCGPDVRPGWISVDFPPTHAGQVHPDVVQWDLSKGVPDSIEPESVDLAMSSHFLEHLDDKDGRIFLISVLNSLKKGGKLRLCLPDAFRTCKNYVEGNWDFFNPVSGFIGDHYPETRTLIDYLTLCVYQAGEHKSVWDAKKAIRVLENLGFSNVYESQFDPTIDLNEPIRIMYSIYVEAVK
jgi:predicted SAM-dependent methyltransferase